MQTIDTTDFWINRPYISNTNNFSILSDKWCNLNNCTIGNEMAYYYNGLVDKQQLKCIVIDDTFYFDFSASPITDVIKQQIWILKHTKNIDYKIEFVCLWEMFNLPTIEELNEFAKIKQEVVVPDQSTVDQYAHAVEEMRLSTGLDERYQLSQISLPLSEYIDLMLRMTHTRLNTNGVIHHATVIHNYHHPVVQAVPPISEDLRLFNDATSRILEFSNLEPDQLMPVFGEDFDAYLDRLVENEELNDLDEPFLPFSSLEEYATIIYNYHASTQPEVIDHPF